MYKCIQIEQQCHENDTIIHKHLVLLQPSTSMTNIETVMCKRKIMLITLNTILAHLIQYHFYFFVNHKI